MIRADEELAALFHVQDHIRTITHRNTKASLKVVAADTDTVSGKKSGKVLVDEHWLFGKQAKAEAMFMEATGGQVSRDEGWVIYLTTQSDEPPAGVFKEKLGYHRDVRDGKIEDKKSLGVLYEFPQKLVDSKGYLDPANFYITNPNIGRSVSAEWLTDALKKVQARTDGPFQQFLAKHLNIEIGLNLRTDRWAGADFWEKAVDPTLTLDELLRRCEVAVIGGDGGGLDDLLGAAVIGRERTTRKWLIWNHAWAHPKVLEKRKELAPRLRGFEQEGSLTICDAPEMMTGIGEVFAKVLASGLLPEKNAVGLDPNNVAALIETLVAHGMTEDMLRRLLQGPALAPAWWGLEFKLSEGTISHSGLDLMRWVVGNAKIEPRGNAILITKQISGRAKIDPLIATGQAAILMSWNPAASVMADISAMVA